MYYILSSEYQILIKFVSTFCQLTFEKVLTSKTRATWIQVNKNISIVLLKSWRETGHIQHLGHVSVCPQKTGSSDFFLFCRNKKFVSHPTHPTPPPPKHFSAEPWKKLAQFCAFASGKERLHHSLQKKAAEFSMPFLQKCSCTNVPLTIRIRQGTLI